MEKRQNNLIKEDDILKKKKKGKYIWYWGIPGGCSGKEPTCHCGRHKRCEFNSWIGKIPWRRAWQPTPVFLFGKSHGQKSLAGYSP